MSRGFPSMTALLGVLAVAGYQNRDKLAEMLGGLTGGSAGAPSTANPQQGRTGGSGASPSDGSIGSMLTEGIRDLVDRFRQAGHGDAADSWVAHGPNREVAPQHLEGAIGADTLDALAEQTGLSREEIISRLTRRCCMDPAGGAAGRAGVAGRPLTCPRMPSVPFKLNQDRRRHIPRQKRKVTNWREYDAGLRQRGSLTVWFTAERNVSTTLIHPVLAFRLGFQPCGRVD